MAERPQGGPEEVEGAAGRVRGAAEGIRRSFRGTGRWQRIRLAIVGGWLLASLLALWIAYPSSGPGNALGADVRVVTDSVLGAQQILVRNDSDVVWTDVVLTLDGTWRLEQRALRPREQVVVSPPQFQRGSEPAPRDLRPRRLDVECRQGRARFDFR